LLAFQLLPKLPVQQGFPIGAFSVPLKVPELCVFEENVPEKLKLTPPGDDEVEAIVNELPVIAAPTDELALTLVIKQQPTTYCWFANSKDITLLSLLTVNVIVPPVDGVPTQVPA